ncbi:hypothetical protein CYMTET_4273 [Cymbomonas tetramitiformis]|uniref:RNase H type-1 domain-containing protein n=1 Tax=Cymbomonas tetramitiformis TaxID=36881 RepID=A0AAE0LKJ6_9CHLO|nr:hypothetical protein CYMTET_4273 [Cymbomonas tetramitiformis]|eukprot:gene1361-1962_t
MGLISGLRRLLREEQGQVIDELEIIGDSELVIRQMDGSYQVQDATLKLYHSTASGLARSARSVSYRQVPRELNQLANKVASDAMTQQSKLDPENMVFYAPNLGGVSVVHVDGLRVYASNDLGTSAHRFMIDAACLASLPSFGLAAFENLGDPRNGVVASKCAMNILGVLLQPLSLSVQLCEDNVGTSEVILRDVLVVESLPVPIHIAVRHPSIKLTPAKFDFDAFPGLLPPAYQAHPYWTSDTTFLSILSPGD